MERVNFFGIKVYNGFNYKSVIDNNCIYSNELFSMRRINNSIFGIEINKKYRYE